jgi:hypothetical protein
LRVSARLTLQPQERRREDRLFTSVPGRTSQGQTMLPVTVTDITSQGCRLELPGRLHEGTEVSLELPGIPRRTAKIVWSRQGSAGCEFKTPLHPDLVRRIGEVPG